MIAPVPGSSSPMVDEQKNPTPTWFRFFASLGAAPPPVAVVQGGSPLTFKAATAGVFSIQGGAVSSIVLLRGIAPVTLSTATGLVPVAKGDQVTVTFSAAPTMAFLPS